MTQKAKNKNGVVTKSTKPYVAIIFIVFIIIWVSTVIYSSFFVPVLDDENSETFTYPNQIYFRYGFNQLHTINLFSITGIFMLIFCLVLFLSTTQIFRQFIGNYFKNYPFPKWTIKLLITLCCTLFLWIFRSNFENTDFLLFKRWFPEHMAFGYLHVRFDEMWESYIHFELYKVFQRSFGLSINNTYQLMSVISGSLFIYFALVLSSALNAEKPYEFVMMIFCGGFMQLFFGDMEHYSIAGMLTFLYLFSSYYYLKEKISLLVPSFVLILAMTFHLEVVFLIPSLFFLFIVQFNKREYLPIIISILLFTGYMSWTILYFLSKGASLQRLIGTSWGLGRGGSILANIVKFDKNYFWGQINLLGLIYPPIWFLIPLVVTGGIRNNKLNIFLVISSIGGIIFLFLWKSTIGLYMDWNLFSPPLIPVAMLFAINFARQEFLFKKQVLLLIFPFSYLMTYSWIIYNHFNFM